MGYLPVDQMIQVRATLEDAGMRALAEIQGQSSNDQGRFVAGVCQVRSNSGNDLALFTNLCIGITRRGTVTGQAIRGILLTVESIISIEFLTVG